MVQISMIYILFAGGNSSTDRLLERNVRILQLPAATQRNKRSLRNWVTATGSVCPQEASFLYERDLCTAENTVDGGLTSVENFVEQLFTKVHSLFCKVSDLQLLNIYS